jgi:hypothetical protein
VHISYEENKNSTGTARYTWPICGASLRDDLQSLTSILKYLIRRQAVQKIQGKEGIAAEQQRPTLPARSSKTVALFRTATSRRSLPFISSSVFADSYGRSHHGQSLVFPRTKEKLRSGEIMVSRLIACMTWTSFGILGPHHVVRDRTPGSESIPVEHNKTGLCGLGPPLDISFHITLARNPLL